MPNVTNSSPASRSNGGFAQPSGPASTAPSVANRINSSVSTQVSPQASNKRGSWWRVGNIFSEIPDELPSTSPQSDLQALGVTRHIRDIAKAVADAHDAAQADGRLSPAGRAEKLAAIADQARGQLAQLDTPSFNNFPATQLSYLKKDADSVQATLANTRNVPAGQEAVHAMLMDGLAGRPRLERQSIVEQAAQAGDAKTLRAAAELPDWLAKGGNPPADQKAAADALGRVAAPEAAAKAERIAGHLNRIAQYRKAAGSIIDKIGADKL